MAFNPRQALNTRYPLKELCKYLMNNKEILMQPYDLRYIRLIHLYFITRSSTHTCMYQRVYTCKHVPLHILVCVPPAPHVLACVCLCVPLHVQVYCLMKITHAVDMQTYMRQYTQQYIYKCMQWQLVHACMYTRADTCKCM